MSTPRVRRSASQHKKNERMLKAAFVLRVLGALAIAQSNDALIFFSIYRVTLP